MVKTKLTKLLLSTALGCLLSSAPSAAKEIDTNMAKLQAMDKITGKVSVIEAPVNGEVKFGSFSIVVRTCRTRPPEETPDNYGFIDVVDKLQDGRQVNIFKGWMISSSPSLNAIEHPIYDVWLLQCVNGKVDNKQLLNAEELNLRDLIIKNNQEPENLLPQIEAVEKTTKIEAESLENKAEEVDALAPSVATSPAPVVTETNEEITIQSDTIRENSEAISNGTTVYESNDNYVEVDDGAPQSLVNIPNDNTKLAVEAVPLPPVKTPEVQENVVKEQTDSAKIEINAPSIAPEVMPTNTVVPAVEVPAVETLDTPSEAIVPEVVMPVEEPSAILQPAETATELNVAEEVEDGDEQLIEFSDEEINNTPEIKADSLVGN